MDCSWCAHPCHLAICPPLACLQKAEADKQRKELEDARERVSQAALRAKPAMPA